MSDNDVEIKLKVGNVEIGYKGNTNFLEKNLSGFVDKIDSVTNQISEEFVNAQLANKTNIDTPASSGNDTSSTTVSLDESFETFATKHLEKKSSNFEIIVCVIAYNTFGNGMNSSSREEIFSVIKGTNYNKTDTNKRFKEVTKTLIKSGRIEQNKSGKYYLSESEKKEFELKIKS